MYKAVLFDLDGTLADTSPGILNSIRYTQRMMGLPEITLEQMYSHVGPPMEESYNRNFGLTGAKLKQAVSYHKEYAVQNGYKELKFYDGIATLLDDLKLRGTKTAVATLKAHTTAVKIFDSFGMTDKFEVVKGTDSIYTGKVQLVEYCLDKLGVTAENAVLVGDSSYDAIAAEEAGVDFIAVTYGFGFKDPKELSLYNCKEVCDSVSALSKYLLD